MSNKLTAEFIISTLDFLFPKNASAWRIHKPKKLKYNLISGIVLNFSLSKQNV